MPSKKKLITKEKQVDQLIRYCKKTGYASIDFETSGHPVQSSLGYPTMLSVSFQPGSAWVIPLGHFDSPFKKKKRWIKILQKFGSEIISNPDIIKIAWNLKFEMLWFLKYDIKMEGRLFDGMLAKYLLNEERPNDLKSMVRKYLPEFASYEDDYEGSHLPWDQKPMEGLSTYCALDADLTFRLMIFFELKLINLRFYSLFRNMLMMATRVLAESEFRGMVVDRDYLETLVEKYRTKIEETDKTLRTNKKIRKFQIALHKDRILKAISKIEDEVEDIQNEIDNSDDDKLIKRKEKQIDAREQKISRHIAKDFTTSKELKLIEEVNFASPAQMAELFFTNPKGFNFKIIKYTTDKQKRETENPSTDEEVLLELKEKDKSGFVKALLDYRGMTKLYSTYVLGMLEKLSENDRVHGSFLLHGTVTGRLSSRNPNLQNIPRDTTAADIKPMFTVPQGYLMLQLDYSQAELRVLAAEAGETTMISWFKVGRDIHLASACKKHGWDYDERFKIWENEDHKLFKETKIARKRAKTINFGIVYGQGAKLLAVTLETSEKVAQQFLNAFDRDFPMIAKHIKKQHRLVKKRGYVKNVFGRKRRLPNINSNEWFKRAEAQRQSVNAPIQGAASDYTLFSSILIYEMIKAGQLPKTLLQCYTVHDSIGYYIKPKDIHKVVPKLEAVCKNPETMKWFGFQIKDVEMKVDFEIGADWGNLRNYNKEIDYTKLTT